MLSHDMTTRTALATRAPAETTRRWTRALLACGTAAGPLLIVVALAQVLTRQGFDLRRHPISMLSLGDLGWIQVANFELTGLLVLLCAVGVRQALRGSPAGTWGPLLLGGYGAGLLAAGIFHPDPALGFPPGARAGMPPLSWHGALHAVAFNVAFLSLIAACFVFARRFFATGQRAFAACCVAAGVLPLLLIALSSAQGGSGVPLFAMGVITSAWVAALPARLLATDR
jgi:hypothetical membrane protein